MLEQQWVLNNHHDKERVQKLAQEINVPLLIASILFNRGITTFEDAKNFFRAENAPLNDPFLMRNMDIAVKRVVEAINNREGIMIYGDYDVDGTTSTSMLYLFFREIHRGFLAYYIPDRVKEGYGLSKPGIAAAHEQGVKLLVAVDCGITAIDQIQLANEFGMDVIICDHHHPGDTLPAALAILNPKQENCPYPFKELCGVGVAFKLAQAITEGMGLDKDLIMRHLDLVAIGSAADIVPLIGENRTLVKNGLKLVSEANKVGIRQLVKNANVQGKPISTAQIVFSLAPRINAVGRLGDANRAVKLLITNNETEAVEYASVLESENRNRRDLNEVMFLEAAEVVESEFDFEKDKVIVVYKEGWHQGVIGIVASKLVERYYRPAIVIAEADDKGKGSARSVENFDVFHALKSCEDLLVGYGGHKYAAGLTIELSKIDEFRRRVNEYAEIHLPPNDLIPKIQIDAQITLDQINDRLITLLNLFKPHGPSNLRPMFLSSQLQIVGYPQLMNERHLRFKVRQNGAVLDAVGFNLAHHYNTIGVGDAPIDMVYQIDENTWQGRTTVQLKIKDLRVHRNGSFN
ncbi:MAG: single-stranded-DNA-specific exonuclease RecJ [Bacteroidetes bacterium]|nr:single-stranded-DNA-specific exonuclease RecJ [Bacteroidota bacterium]